MMELPSQKNSRTESRLKSSQSGIMASSLSRLVLNNRLRAYVDILVVGSIARMFGLASNLVVLLMLSRLLPKDSFGDLMTAFGFYRLVGIAFGVAGSLVLIFHVSRRVDDYAHEIMLQRFSAVVIALPSAAIALVALFAAGPVAHALGKPSLANWLQQLAPFLIFTSLLIVATGALEGRSRIGESIFWGEVAPNVVRIALLPLGAVLDLPPAYVAHVLTLSVLVPWLCLSRRMWDRSVSGWLPWSGWDFRYCGKFIVVTLFANQLGAVDLVIAGILFSSATVADYAVAARLAALFTFFQVALLKRFVPRAGRLLQAKEHAELQAEAEVCRRMTIGCTALSVAALLVLAPLVLPLLGNFMDARVLLIWLAIPSFVQSFYAISDRLLVIAGQANVALIFTAATFSVLVASPFATAPWLGPLAIPAAMIFSMVCFNPLLAVRARQLLGVRTIGLSDAALMACGGSALAASALAPSLIKSLITYALLGAIGAYYIMTAMSRSGTDDYSSIPLSRGGTPVSEKASK
jgi:O-antigen/teichoic acid export membrane protein